jgi:hypothetical protein
MSESVKKQLVYFNEFKEIVSIFGQTEVGTDEVDIEALSEYLSSDKFFVDLFDYKTKDIESIDWYITNLIENGFPVWQFLKISDWTKNMIEKSFKKECQEELKELQQTYCCLSCQHYMIKDTSIGLLVRCTNKNCKQYFGNRNGPLQLQEKCKEYKEK